MLTQLACFRLISFQVQLVVFLVAFFFSLTTSEPRQLLVMFLPLEGELEVWRQGATFEDSARELAAKKLPRARLSLRMSWRTVCY